MRPNWREAVTSRRIFKLGNEQVQVSALPKRPLLYRPLQDVDVLVNNRCSELSDIAASETRRVVMSSPSPSSVNLRTFLAITVGIFCLGLQSLHAQVDTGTIVGTVTD